MTLYHAWLYADGRSEPDFMQGDLSGPRMARSAGSRARRTLRRKDRAS